MTVLAAGEVSPGLLGFVVVAGLGFALYMLIKSMNKQMSRIQVPREHEQDTDQAEPAQASAQAAGKAARGADGKAGE
ncbi:hypothetical protein AB0K12_24500 [Nonomuraea sp. NPDC049419]|uniref:hypothetical protein n=1 Tax=Nonomuraea sp. NPDC049419 TaxID=3155772 RepID=UPI00341E9DE0